MNKCNLCGQKIQKKTKYCQSCIDFIEWKYGSVDDYEDMMAKIYGDCNNDCGGAT